MAPQAVPPSLGATVLLWRERSVPSPGGHRAGSHIKTPCCTLSGAMYCLLVFPAGLILGGPQRLAQLIPSLSLADFPHFHFSTALGGGGGHLLNKTSYLQKEKHADSFTGKPSLTQVLKITLPWRLIPFLLPPCFFLLVKLYQVSSVINTVVPIIHFDILQDPY